MNYYEKQTHDKPGMIAVDDDASGQRLDNFLLSRLKGVPKSHIYRIIRKGEVRVNKGRTRPDYRLKPGDQIRIPPIRLAERQAVDRGQATIALKRLKVLYEDARLLIVDKPSGLAVHGGSGVSLGVIEALRSSRPELHYIELVHRLDRDTSGCLMLAKKRSVLRSLHELMRENRIDKRYWALVRGRPTTAQWYVDAPLEKRILRSGERVVHVSETGKPARTRFRVLEYYADSTLVEAVLDTGRTHQIRVHLTHCGYPIAGDPRYGDDAFNSIMKGRGLRRLFLHARALSLKLDDELEIMAPLPDELDQVLQRLASS